MRILVICVGDPDTTASTLFRFGQYRALFEASGATLTFVARRTMGLASLPALRGYDVVVNQKSPLNPLMAILVRLFARRLVFDFDDCMWSRPGRPYHWFVRTRLLARFRLWLRLSDAVTVSSRHLASYFPAVADRTRIVPMALDLTRWRPAETRSSTARRVIGWAGTPVNFLYLRRIETALADFLRDHPDWELWVYSGQRPDLACPFRHVPFVPGTEHAFVQQLDIGLLPLTEDEHSACKSPIKALQYLACGVPVVANRFGATREILDDDNSLQADTLDHWRESLARLAGDDGLRERMSQAALSRARQRFDARIVGHELLAAVATMVGNDRPWTARVATAVRERWPGTGARRARHFERFMAKNRFLRSSVGVIHIGANLGQERDHYARLGLPVVWIEPIPTVFAQLSQNLRDYPAQRAIQALLTDRPGQRLTFNVASNGGASSSIFDFARHRELWPEVHMSGRIEIESDTLDALMERGEIEASAYDTLVIDTQGAELLVLKGAASALARCRFVKAEAADFEAYSGCCTVDQIAEHLAEHGFTEVSREVFKSKPGVGSYFDVLYERR